MAQGSYNLGGDEVKEESSWRYPLLIFGATLILCAIFLYHYMGPDVDEFRGNSPRPTISDEQIALSVAGLVFEVPANYTRFPRDRTPGDRDVISLYASWPRLEGYTPARRGDFVDNEPDARRIDILIQAKQNPFVEAERLEILYLPRVVDKDGAPFDHNLTRFTFQKGSNLEKASGYASKEMFTGRDSSGAVAVLFCSPADPSGYVPADCYREFDLNDRVSVKYYFMRPYLPEWQRIDTRVRELITELRTDS